MLREVRFPSPAEWPALIKRPLIERADLNAQITATIEAVRREGDNALRDLTKRFDGAELETLEVSRAEIDASENRIPQRLRDAIRIAAGNIERFHVQQRQRDPIIETMRGVRCWRRSVAIEKVGLYVPGGSAPLFSTVLMLAVPARIAGCRQRIICTPPRRSVTAISTDAASGEQVQSGSVHPAILFAAKVADVSSVFQVGGAQAIAALAIGTESIPAVDKIFGPGNQYVTAAKQIVAQQGVAIDLPAGPSEVAILADFSAKPEFVAADLLAQAEHGSDSQVFLVTDNAALLAPVLAALERQLETLPRADLARAALAHSVAILVNDLNEGMDLVNLYAPEHLILACNDADLYAERVRNAGSVFVGHLSAESFGDYASGTNHTLPTGGFARGVSGVSLESFIKKITFQQVSPAGIESLGWVVEEMAAAEELAAHGEAIRIRRRDVRPA